LITLKKIQEFRIKMTEAINKETHLVTECIDELARLQKENAAYKAAMPSLSVGKRMEVHFKDLKERLEELRAENERLRQQGLDSDKSWWVQALKKSEEKLEALKQRYKDYRRLAMEVVSEREHLRAKLEKAESAITMWKNRAETYGDRAHTTWDKLEKAKEALTYYEHVLQTRCRMIDHDKGVKARKAIKDIEGE